MENFESDKVTGFESIMPEYFAVVPAFTDNQSAYCSQVRDLLRIGRNFGQSDKQLADAAEIQEKSLKGWEDNGYGDLKAARKLETYLKDIGAIQPIDLLFQRWFEEGRRLFGFICPFALPNEVK